MSKTIQYLFVIVFLLLSFIQFKLFYNTYNLKQDELHIDIQKRIQMVKLRVEKHETERHKILFEKYKKENLCGNTYSNKNLDLTFRITPTDSFSNLKDLTDVITKKLANQALESGTFMLASLPLDSVYIDQIVREELNALGNNIGFTFQLSANLEQTSFTYNSQVLLFDDYRLYHPTYLLLNITGLSKMLIYQIALMLIICLGTMLMLFIVTRYAYLSIVKFKKLSDDKADFISHLAHEIKTPLSSIYVSSQALNDSRIVNNGETVGHYSDIIFLEAERLHRQLENVLSISAADKNFLTLRMEEINIHELILQVSELFIKRITLQNGKMFMHLNATQNMFLLDKIHFGNVLYNLFDNAVKYSAKDKVNIKVETTDSDSGIIVHIQDEGRGISELEQKKMFTMFYKKDARVKGFGVGLHYAKKIMQYHKGMIDVKSKIGLGTTFSLYLPNNPHE
jgi:two-component system phosphate regulon sensor histidine kinase PhoR